MHRRTLLLAVAVLAIAATACTAPTSPSGESSVSHDIGTARTVPSKSTTACDSTSAAASDSTGPCRTPFVPWH